MIINHTHKFIFVHIPKAAGTTVARILSQFSTYRDQEIGATDLGEACQPHTLARFGLRKHSTADDIRAVVGEEVWSSYFKFAVVRDPVSRTVSTYRFLNRWREWDGSEIMDSLRDVNEFVASDYWQTLGMDEILRPQTDFVAGLDFIGRSESLDACLSVVGDRIGAPSLVAAAVDFANADPDGLGPARLDRKTLERIAIRYNRDFVDFGYSVDWTAAA